MLFGGLVAIALTSCDTGPHMMIGGDPPPTSYKSNGERIYFTATSASGDSISSLGGSIHMRMMGGNGCAACHGRDRRGEVRMMPQFWKSAPAITPEALFEDHAEGDGDGHGDHDGYTDDTLRRAISQGINPSGEPLDDIMPRWSMSERDWQDLLAYLSHR
jgi:mono/diheme cytochrome c family protein